jgi:hypothetical protein
MTLPTHAFIRRFLMHVLPAGFHRIRYYGLLASGQRAENVARARELLAQSLPLKPSRRSAPMPPSRNLCPCCGGRMIIIVLRDKTRLE